MTPAEHVREHLAAARAAGVPFAQAWLAALEALPVPRSGREHDDWGAALDATRSDWRRAYLGLPPLPAERTAAALGSVASVA